MANLFGNNPQQNNASQYNNKNNYNDPIIELLKKFYAWYTNLSKRARRVFWSIIIFVLAIWAAYNPVRIWIGTSQMNSSNYTEFKQISKAPGNRLHEETYHFDPFSAFSDNLSDGVDKITSPYNLSFYLTRGSDWPDGLSIDPHINMSKIKLGMTGRQVIAATNYCGFSTVKVHGFSNHSTFDGSIGQQIIDVNDVSDSYKEEDKHLSYDESMLIHQINNNCLASHNAIGWIDEFDDNPDDDIMIFFQSKDANQHSKYGWRVVAIAKRWETNDHSNQYHFKIKAVDPTAHHVWVSHDKFSDNND